MPKQSFLTLALIASIVITLGWLWSMRRSDEQVVLDRPVVLELAMPRAQANNVTPARWRPIAEKFRPDQPSTVLAELLHHIETGASLPYRTGDEQVRTALLRDFLADQPIPIQSSSTWLYRDEEKTPRGRRGAGVGYTSSQSLRL